MSILLRTCFCTILALTACEKVVKRAEAAEPLPTPSPVATPTPTVILEQPQAPLVETPWVTIAPQALNLIVEYEVGGRSGYDPHPEWPGGYSGVTWGIGYDGGYSSEKQILWDWKKSPDADRLSEVAGITGRKAKSILPTVIDIIISWGLATEVFNETTIPSYAQATKRTFPGSEELCPEAFGALVSLVYNRGTQLNGASRVDMRKIKELVPKKDYEGIADAIEHMNVTMANTWKSQGVFNGLSARRNSEAKLVRSCISVKYAGNP